MRKRFVTGVAAATLALLPLTAVAAQDGIAEIVVATTSDDGVQVVKVVNVLLEAGPVQVGAGRGDVGVVGHQVGVGIGAGLGGASGIGWLPMAGIRAKGIG